mmetsp:Transcript_104176/g.271246  ORF Transcript_104176/g.271246 Transcript_104176/m.271246 type:complete len:201 (-) Transcript_104176:27-629(-)
MEMRCQQCRNVRGAVGGTRRTAHSGWCRQWHRHRRRPRHQHDVLQARRQAHGRRRQAVGAQEEAGGRPRRAARDAPSTHERLRHPARGGHPRRAACRRLLLLLLALLELLPSPPALDFWARRRFGGRWPSASSSEAEGKLWARRAAWRFSRSFFLLLSYSNLKSLSFGGFFSFGTWCGFVGLGFVGPLTNFGFASPLHVL